MTPKFSIGDKVICYWSDTDTITGTVYKISGRPNVVYIKYDRLDMYNRNSSSWDVNFVEKLTPLHGLL